jgi:hypothetical protein
MTPFYVTRYSCKMYWSFEIDNYLLNRKVACEGLLDWHVLYQLMQ